MEEQTKACACDKASEEELAARLGQVLDEYGNTPGALIPVLQIAQGIYGYLPVHVIKRIAASLGIPYSRAAGVTGFYSFFSTTPRGKHLIRVCLGTACYVRGGKQVLDQIKKLTGVDVGDTTPDGMFSLEVARCFGACGLAPVITIDEDVHQRVKPAVLRRILDRYRRERPIERNRSRERHEALTLPVDTEPTLTDRIESFDEFEQAVILARGAAEADSVGERVEITMHMGTCGIASGARDVLIEIVDELEKGEAGNVILHRSGCRGLCAHEPMCTVTDQRGRHFCYGDLDGKKARRIIQDHVLRGTPVAEYMVKG